MELRVLQDQLTGTAQRMLDLSDRLKAKGKPLNKEEEELCRLAMFGLLTASLDEIKFLYLSGCTDDFEHAVHSLTQRFTI